MTEMSPYLKLRDTILGQGDFVKKQIEIIKFKNHFTRDANIAPTAAADTITAESPYWCYCIKTNTKLLPTFFVEIAEAFIKNEDYYSDAVINIIDIIC